MWPRSGAGGKEALEAGELIPEGAYSEGIVRVDSTQVLLAAVPTPSDWLSVVGWVGDCSFGHSAEHMSPCPPSDLELFCKYLVLTSHAAPPVAHPP